MNEAPLNPLPPVVWLLALPLVAMEVLLSAGASGLLSDPMAIGWRLDAVQRFAFSPVMFRQMLELGLWPWDGAMRLVTYALVHGSFTDALFVVVFLLALGKFVGEVFQAWAVITVALLATIAGALAYAALPWTQAGLIGGWPAVYGLIGAFTFVLWVRLGKAGAARGRAFSLIGMLLAIQLVFVALFGGGDRVAAELAGFATGFATSFVVSPGGWQAVMARLRDR